MEINADALIALIKKKGGTLWLPQQPLVQKDSSMCFYVCLYKWVSVCVRAHMCVCTALRIPAFSKHSCASVCKMEAMFSCIRVCLISGLLKKSPQANIDRKQIQKITKVAGRCEWGEGWDERKS